MSADDHNQIMNYLVRMITPMRREFGRNLDVQQFLHDVAYATEVMDQALRSQDTRLLDYANYVQQRFHGPRVGNPPAPSPVPAPAAKLAKDAPIDTSKEDALLAEEAELKARMLKKYTDGLR